MAMTQKYEASFIVADSNLFRTDRSSTSGSAEDRRVRSALLNSISRDVGRPLALICGAAASLRSRGGSSDASVRSELIGVIEEETKRVERFAAILLDMAKLACDAFVLHTEAVNIQDVVGMALAEATSALGDRRTDVSLAADLPTLRVDSEILQRVLFILIENAAQQSPPGSAVGIHAARDQTAIRLQILDEGGGIPETKLGGLFEQFHLSHADDWSRLGGGMHLAVCRGYVEAMGGTISGYNRTDRSGAVFTISFPVSA